MEFIVRNYEEYEEAIKASKLLCAVFSADSEPSSVALSEAVRAGLGEELAGHQLSVPVAVGQRHRLVRARSWRLRRRARCCFTGTGPRWQCWTTQ